MVRQSGEFASSMYRSRRRPGRQTLQAIADFGGAGDRIERRQRLGGWLRYCHGGAALEKK